MSLLKDDLNALIFLTYWSLFIRLNINQFGASSDLSFTTPAWMPFFYTFLLNHSMDSTEMPLKCGTDIINLLCMHAAQLLRGL